MLEFAGHVISLQASTYFSLLTHRSVLMTHFSPSVTSLPSCFIPVRPRERQKTREGRTHQHAIISMVMQKQHSRLQPHHNLLLNRRSPWKIIRIERRLTAPTAGGGRGEVEEQSPGCLCWCSSRRREGNEIRFIVYGHEHVILKRGRGTSVGNCSSMAAGRRTMLVKELTFSVPINSHGRIQSDHVTSPTVFP